MTWFRLTFTDGKKMTIQADDAKLEKSTLDSTPVYNFYVNGQVPPLSTVVAANVIAWWRSTTQAGLDAITIA